MFYFSVFYVNSKHLLLFPRSGLLSTHMCIKYMFVLSLAIGFDIKKNAYFLFYFKSYNICQRLEFSENLLATTTQSVFKRQ